MKIVYCFDKDGFYIGDYQCQIDPMESNKAGREIYLVPPGTTEQEPPAPGEDQELKWGGSSWGLVESRAAIKRKAKEKKEAEDKAKKEAEEAEQERLKAEFEKQKAEREEKTRLAEEERKAEAAARKIIKDRLLAADLSANPVLADLRELLLKLV